MIEPGPGRFDEEIPAALAGERVDRAVALLTGLTRGDVAALVDAGSVVVDGRPVTTRSRRVKAAQRLEVQLPATVAAAAPSADPSVPVPVVYEDGDVVVVDKPAGLVVHPGAGVSSATLVHGLLARYPELADLAVDADIDRPGIVHRLDRGTSGLLVVARTAGARDALRRQLAAHEVDRSYDALVVGRVSSDEGAVEAPVGRSNRDPTRMTVAADGKPARTRYVVTGRFEHPVPTTRLTCNLETGRTHQIRVHLTAIGHPVVGDERYGGRRSTVLDGWRPLPGDRPWLHARALTFTHPTSGGDVHFESELPADLTAVRDRLS